MTAKTISADAMETLCHAKGLIAEIDTARHVAYVNVDGQEYQAPLPPRSAR